MPAALQVAQFAATYGWSAYYGPYRETRDGIVPHKLFQVFYSALPNLWALHRLNDQDAMLLAIVRAFQGEKDPKIKRLVKKLAEEAIPLQEM